MSEPVVMRLNGKDVAANPASTVAAAIINSGLAAFRSSRSGQPRGPLCGMGICFECLVTIDGQRQVRSCQIQCPSGMVVETDPP